jgi:lipoyl(octanoyl) transferase
MKVRWLGSVPYEEALALQRATRDALITEGGEGTLLLLEHPPVITTGRRSVEDLDPQRVADAGYALVATERGGLATCHEPGQLVGYLLWDARRLGVKRTVCAVQGAISSWLRRQGVAAASRDGYPGVWVGNDKVCAIGLHFREGRTMHGFALNLTNDLRGFGLITPCGIVDGGVTSLLRLTGGMRAPSDVAAEIAKEVVETLDASEWSVNSVCAAGT